MPSAEPAANDATGSAATWIAHGPSVVLVHASPVGTAERIGKPVPAT